MARRLIREIDRIPAERSTTYEIRRIFEDPADDPPSLEPDRERELSGPARFREGSSGDQSALLQIEELS